MRTQLVAACVVLTLWCGCGGEPVAPVEPSRTFSPPPPAPAATSATGDTTAAAKDGAPAADPPVEGKPVEVGAGRKSQQIKGSGYLPTVVRTKFRVEEGIHLRNAEYAIKLYKAGHDGKGPPTHEAYMEEIIKANRIQLPELPPGHEYRYDPETEQLLDVESGNE